MFWQNILSLFSKKSKTINWNKDDDNKLLVHLEYIHHGAYSSSNKSIKSSLEKLLEYFKGEFSDRDYVYIESKFNNINYPFFDLDTEENKELFLQTHQNDRYVLFQSSPEHYWAILDGDFSLNQILNDSMWISCNDSKYVSISKEQKNLRIRGLFENMVRKPKIISKNLEDKFSDNFQQYIEKMVSYYNNEGLELSVLKYKTPELILHFDRKRKLQQLSEND